MTMSQRQLNGIRDIVVIITLFVIAISAIQRGAHAFANFIALVGLFYIVCSLQSKSV